MERQSTDTGESIVERQSTCRGTETKKGNGVGGGGRERERGEERQIQRELTERGGEREKQTDVVRVLW